ncbi:MAG: TPR repeat protein [Myxococcota bacterium]|jgi:TPR repeat protein
MKCVWFGLALVVVGCGSTPELVVQPTPPPARVDPEQKAGLIRDLLSHGVDPVDARACGELAGATDLGVRCTAGERLACACLGTGQSVGAGQTLDKPGGFGLLQKACAEPTDNGCYELGRSHEYARGTTRDPAAARLRFEPLCAQRRSGHACFQLALSLARDEGHDKAKVARLYRLSCQFGLSLGCVRWGNAAWFGSGTEQSDQVGIKAFQQACKDGLGEGCWRLARIKTDLQSAQLQDVARHYKAGCDLQHGKSCNDLGLAQKSAGHPFSKVRGTYRRACEFGSVYGCLNEADGLLDAKNGSTDPAAAARLLAHACERHKNQRGCAELGALLLQGQKPVAPQPERALTLLRGACVVGGPVAGCADLALAHEKGLGIPADTDKAASLRARYCAELGYEETVCRKRPYKAKRLKAKVVANTMPNGPAPGTRCEVGLTELYEGDLCQIYVQCDKTGFYGDKADPHWVRCTLDDKRRVLTAKDDAVGDGDGRLELDLPGGRAVIIDDPEAGDGRLELKFKRTHR